MNTRFKFIILVLLFAAMAPQAHSQRSLGDLINTAKGVVDDLKASSTFTIEDIAGNYKYNAPAVSLKGDNALKNIGGAAAASQVEQKLAPYYSTSGIDKLEMTIAPDSTFTMKVKSISLSGVIAHDEEGLIFTFDKVKRQPIKCIATRSGDKLALCFDASKLIILMDTLSKYVNSGSVTTLASLLKSYKGLYIGFELIKVNAPQSN